MPASVLGCVVALVTTVSGCGAEGGQRSDPTRDRGQAGQSSPSATTPGALGLTVVGIDARIGRERVLSSGTIIDADQGLVLTSAHTVWGATSVRLATGLGVLHGRIVARAPCGDVALVETQPRLPGLTALRPERDAVPREGDRLTVVGRTSEGAASGSSDLVRIPTAPLGSPTRVRIAPALPRLEDVLRLSVLVPAASGAPIVTDDDRMVAMALTSGGSGKGRRAAAVPAATLTRLIAELQPGRKRLYRGWNRHYRCAPRLHAHASAAHPGFRPDDARLGAPVPATRLPGTEALNR